MEELIKRLKKKHGTTRKRKHKQIKKGCDLNDTKQLDLITEECSETKNDNKGHRCLTMTDDIRVFSVFNDTSNMMFKVSEECTEKNRDKKRYSCPTMTDDATEFSICSDRSNMNLKVVDSSQKDMDKKLKKSEDSCKD